MRFRPFYASALAFFAAACSHAPRDHLVEEARRALAEHIDAEPLSLGAIRKPRPGVVCGTIEAPNHNGMDYVGDRFVYVAAGPDRGAHIDGDGYAAATTRGLPAPDFDRLYFHKYGC